MKIPTFAAILPPENNYAIDDICGEEGSGAHLGRLEKSCNPDSTQAPRTLQGMRNSHYPPFLS
jgi:hypothetical protein